MQNSEPDESRLSRTSLNRTRLSAGIFYGIILGGLFLGIVTFCLGGWAYLEFSDRTPTGHRIWDGIARLLVIPICAMIGATFGGLVGVGVSVLITVWGTGCRKNEIYLVEPTPIRVICGPLRQPAGSEPFEGSSSCCQDASSIVG
jgi:hypothetical protein